MDYMVPHEIHDYYENFDMPDAPLIMNVEPPREIGQLITAFDQNLKPPSKTDWHITDLERGVFEFTKHGLKYKVAEISDLTTGAVDDGTFDVRRRITMLNERKKYDRLRAKQIVVTTASGQFIVNTSEEGWREDFAKASANPSPGDTIAMIDGNNAITSGLKAGISGWEPVELSHKDDRGDRKLTRRRQRVQTAHHSEAAAMYPDWAKHPHSARVIGVSPGSYSTIVASEPWLRRQISASWKGKGSGEHSAAEHLRKARQQLGNLKLKDDKGAVLTHPLFQSPHQQTAEEIAAKRARVAERERVKFRNEKRVMVEKGALVKREQNLFELGMSRFKALNPDMVIDMEASKKRNDEKINAMVVEKYGRDWLTKHDTKVEK